MQAIVFSWMMMLGMLHGAGTNFPVDMFQTTSHNFGTVVKGTKTEFDFEFTNIFVEDVVIESVTSSCQCTTPSFGPRGPIKTGQKGKIHISVNTQNFTGTKNATITVRFARPYRAEMQLHSYVYIRSDVSVNPGIVYFGSVDPKTRPAVPVNINSVNQGWQIRDVQSECKFLSVELKKHPNYASSYTMVVRLKENAPPGPFSEILEVITNDYDPRSQRVPVRVQGRVKQTLSASPSPLAFNIVEEGGAAEKTLVIQGAEPFRITDITSESRNISASIEHDARKIHPIKLTYHGKDVGDFTGGITVFTDLEGGMSTQVQFSGRVIPAPEEEPAPKMDAVPEIDAAPEKEAAPETGIQPEKDADPGLAPLPSPNEEEETNDAETQKEEPSEPALDGLLNLEETSGENDAEAPKKEELPAAEDKKATGAESLDDSLDASLTDEDQEAPKQEKETDGVELLDLPDLEDEEIVPETKEADGTEKAGAENADDSDDAETPTDSKETDEGKIDELPESLNFKSKPGLADEAPKRNAPLSLDDLIEESTPNNAEETPKAEETDESLPADEILPKNDVLPEQDAVPAEKKEEADANAGVETLDDGLGIDLPDDEEEENAEQETPDALPLDAELPESDIPAANEEEVPAILDDASSKEVNEKLDDPAPLDGLDELPDEGPAETENVENENPEIKKVKAPADEVKAPANEEIPAEDADETKDAAPQTVEEPDDLSALFADPASQDPAPGPSVSETSEVRPNESVQPIGRNLLKHKI